RSSQPASRPTTWSRAGRPAARHEERTAASAPGRRDVDCDSSYGVQDAATMRPDFTRKAGELASAAAFDADSLALLSSAPMSSTFFPTCGVNADAFAISR